MNGDRLIWGAMAIALTAYVIFLPGRNVDGNTGASPSNLEARLKSIEETVRQVQVRAPESRKTAPSQDAAPYPPSGQRYVIIPGGFSGGYGGFVSEPPRIIEIVP